MGKARMCWAVALVLVGGCGDSTMPVPDSMEPVGDIPMQILVSEGRVQIYTGAIDLMPCSCSAVEFPATGNCAFLTDAGPCSSSPYCRSCFTDIGVEADGLRLAPTGYGGHDPHTLFYGTFPTAQLTLVLDGCGRGTVRIPLDGPALPKPTVQATYVNGVPTVAWTTDLPAESTMLTLYGGTHGELCQTQNVGEYAFEDWMYAQSASVQAFGSRTEVVTVFGPATIWRGGVGNATFP